MRLVQNFKMGGVLLDMAIMEIIFSIHPKCPHSKDFFLHKFLSHDKPITILLLHFCFKK